MVPGCPSNSVLLFLDEVNRKLEETGTGRPQQPPVVIHCSAGIGRTGTFIVLDILLNRIKTVGPHCIIDIPKANQTHRVTPEYCLFL